MDPKDYVIMYILNVIATVVGIFVYVTIGGSF